MTDYNFPTKVNGRPTLQPPANHRAQPAARPQQAPRQPAPRQPVPRTQPAPPPPRPVPQAQPAPQAQPIPHVALPQQSAAAPVSVRREGISSFLADCVTMTHRNLLIITRVPQLLLGATLQPLMFVLLFSYVFGGALGGATYRQFLMGGIFTQTVVFSAAFTAIGLATDSKEGIVERFHSLPMSRLSIVLGRTVTDALVTIVSIVVMIGAGFLVGWRIDSSYASALGGIALLVFFGFAMSWMGAVVGLVAATAESAQSILMIIVFPITFISSAFVPSATLPGPLRAVAQWNPITSVARATREAFGNPTSPSSLVTEPVTWASTHPALYSFIASILLLAVFVPLTLKVSGGRK